MTVKDIISPIETFAPPVLQEDYDNTGLICGNFTSEVRSVLLTTDVTEEVVDEAIAEGYNLIISHHPLTLQGLNNIIPDNYIKRCLIKAIKHDINIYSAHTNMDAVANGVSGRMADKIGLVNRSVLQTPNKLFSLTFYTPAKDAGKVRMAILDSGAGHIGNYSHCSFNSEGTGTFKAGDNANPFVGEIGELHNEPEIKTEITVPEHLLNQSIKTLLSVHPYEEPVWNAVCLNNSDPSTGFGIIGELEQPEETTAFLKRIKETFRCQVIRHTPLCKSEVKRVALCGGSGAFLTKAAIRQKADIFISGDFKYHDFFQAENHIILTDIGHYESEQFTKEIFYELLTKKITKFAVQFSKVETNPINYL